MSGMMEELFGSMIGQTTIRTDRRLSDAMKNQTNGIDNEIIKEKNMNSMKKRAEYLMEEAARLMEKAAVIEEKFGSDESYKDGDIIWADIQFTTRGRIYNYAFIKANGQWYSSGPRAGGTAFSWERLTDWMHNEVSVKRFGTTRRSTTYKRSKDADF